MKTCCRCVKRSAIFVTSFTSRYTNGGGTINKMASREVLEDAFNTTAYLAVKDGEGNIESTSE